MKKYWTEKEIAYLKKNLNKQSNKELGKKFNLSVSAIENVLQKFNLKRDRWSTTKINKLKKLVDTHSNKELSKLFNTSQASIACVCSRFGIKRKSRPNEKKIEFLITEKDCWVCTSHCKNKEGYPYYKFNGKVGRMHRYMYEKYKGKIPEGYIVRHACDNPSCINPDHLLLGTHKDNKQDSINRKRHAKGTSVHSAKLTEKDVKEIRKLLKNKYYGYMQNICKKFNVSSDCIYNIKNNKSWKHI